MIVDVPKKESQTAEGIHIQPDTDAKWWQVVEERENGFVIEILGEA